MCLQKEESTEGSPCSNSFVSVNWHEQQWPSTLLEKGNMVKFWIWNHKISYVSTYLKIFMNLKHNKWKQKKGIEDMKEYCRWS